MEYIRNSLDFHIEKPTAITLGKFDGLHRGHELLMEQMFEAAAQEHLATVAFTFDIPPKNQIEDAFAKVLTTNEEKHLVFEKTGIDYLIECPFTKEIMCMEAEDFIAWIVSALSVRCIVVGTDFHFGHNRAGDYHVLQAFEKKYGYRTVVVDKVTEDGRDISSTFIREEIMKGNFPKANHLLGYEFFLKSRIIHGRQIGRKMGIPTINMKPEPQKILPPFGVYVTRVVSGEKWYKSVSNVGVKPTIEGDNPVGVETYILDFCQDVYEEEMTVQFLDYIRSEQKFDSLDELQQQISSDIAYAEKYYKNITKIC
jgi:riboflavin kinase/FMN adenylyltransferase